GGNELSIATINWRIKYRTRRFEKMKRRMPPDDSRLQKLLNIIANLKSTRSKLLAQQKLDKNKQKKRPESITTEEPEDVDMENILLNSEDVALEGIEEEYDDQEEEEIEDKEGSADVSEKRLVSGTSYKIGMKRGFETVTTSTPPAKKMKKSKETSRSRLQRLTTATKRLLLLENFSIDSITVESLQEEFSNLDLDAQEAKTMKNIYCFLKPFVLCSTGEIAVDRHPLLNAPLVLLANTIFAVTDYKKFSRSTCPIVRPSAIYSLVLNPTSTFEVLCNVKDDNMDGFDVFGPDGKIITTLPDARHNPDYIMGAFFNLNALDRICQKHGLKFDH
ncbi:hypothetical protein EC973_008735, partial [Apophysomyces ossiformis]